MCVTLVTLWVCFHSCSHHESVLPQTGSWVPHFLDLKCQIYKILCKPARLLCGSWCSCGHLSHCSPFLFSFTHPAWVPVSVVKETDCPPALPCHVLQGLSKTAALWNAWLRGSQQHSHRNPPSAVDSPSHKAGRLVRKP